MVFLGTVCNNLLPLEMQLANQLLMASLVPLIYIDLDSVEFVIMSRYEKLMLYSEIIKYFKLKNVVNRNNVQISNLT